MAWNGKYQTSYLIKCGLCTTVIFIKFKCYIFDISPPGSASGRRHFLQAGEHYVLGGIHLNDPVSLPIMLIKELSHTEALFHPGILNTPFLLRASQVHTNEESWTLRFSLYHGEKFIWLFEDISVHHNCFKALFLLWTLQLIDWISLGANAVKIIWNA